jgi:hypothetical protein
MRLKIVILALISIIVGSEMSDRVAPAADSRTVNATGVAALSNLTPAEAQKLALERARQNAIEKVCGVSVQAETFVKNNMLEADFIHSLSFGHIIAEKILRWDASVTQDSKKRPPQIAYRVTIRATVKKERGKPDPFYQVNCQLNKKVYQSGDEMIITVTTTKPSYLSVLNFSADGSVTLLFPNRIHRDNYLRGMQKLQIPSEAERTDVMKLQVSTLPGHRKNTEYIQVIATRERHQLLEGLLIQGQYGVMDSVKVAATQIARIISAIPLKDRAGHTVFYEVVSAQ